MTIEHMTIREFTSVGQHRLGRHVNHDSQSWDYPAPMAPHLITKRWTRLVDPYNQGPLGSCTGNAGAGMASTSPFTNRLTETDAVSIYADATHRDNIIGIYPPNDTGSSGLAVAKVLKSRGLIKGYTHSFSLAHALRAVVKSPGMTGIAWRTGCDTPDSHGVVKYTGAIRGGHEFEFIGIDVDTSLVWFCNSWGIEWGLRGLFAMSFDDYGKALSDHGDVTFPVM